MNKPMWQHKQLRAFTLIEILIALAIFAVIAAIATVILHNAVNTQIRLKQTSNNMAQQQLATSLINQDLAEIVNQTWMIGPGQTVGPLQGQMDRLTFIRWNSNLELTATNPDQLEQVSYFVNKHHELIRTVAIPDNGQLNIVHTRVLLNQVRSINFGYLGAAQGYSQHWPTADRSIADALAMNLPETMPRAIELLIHFNNLKGLTLYFAPAVGQTFEYRGNSHAN